MQQLLSHFFIYYGSYTCSCCFSVSDFLFSLKKIATFFCITTHHHSHLHPSTTTHTKCAPTDILIVYLHSWNVVLFLFFLFTFSFILSCPYHLSPHHKSHGFFLPIAVIYPKKCFIPQARVVAYSHYPPFSVVVKTMDNEIYYHHPSAAVSLSVSFSLDCMGYGSGSLMPSIPNKQTKNETRKQNKITDILLTLHRPFLLFKTMDDEIYYHHLPLHSLSCHPSQTNKQTKKTKHENKNKNNRTEL
ncbi:hypothetical protein BYT27DRAFT_6465894 [Phlegmacium glaucopus]|nr:hypothetical protein BYT27DRAFT_6465894 [Phlegmacium glaucopus]